jgi:hypothetical protein
MQKKCTKLEETNVLQADSLYRIIDFLKVSNTVNSLKITDCVVWDVKSKDSLKLSDLLKKSSKNIIFRLINTSCSSCNTEQIEILNYLQKFDNVIALSNLSNARELRLFLHENSIEFPIYYVNSQEKIFLEEDNTKILILFTDQKGTILRVYYLEEDTFFLIKTILPLPSI